MRNAQKRSEKKSLCDKAINGYLKLTRWMPRNMAILLTLLILVVTAILTAGSWYVLLREVILPTAGIDMCQFLACPWNKLLFLLFAGAAGLLKISLIGIFFYHLITDTKEANSG